MGLDLVTLEVATYSVHQEELVIENAIHKMTDNIGEMSLSSSERER